MEIEKLKHNPNISIYNKEKRYYVYCYIDETYTDYKFELNGKIYKGKPFYIGKGTSTRDIFHWNFAKLHNKQTPFYSKLSKMVKENNTPKIVHIYDNIDELTAYDLETKCIAKLDIFENGGPLLNLNYGGTGGVLPTQKVKNKISNSRKGKCIGIQNYFYGKDHSGINNAFYGKHHSEESKIKMRRIYYIGNLETESYEKIDNIAEYCNKHNISLVLLISRCNRFMCYKNLILLKDNEYDIHDVEYYFNYAFSNKQNIFKSQWHYKCLFDEYIKSKFKVK